MAELGATGKAGVPGPLARHRELAELLYELTVELDGFSQRMAARMDLHPTDVEAVRVLHATTEHAGTREQLMTVGALGEQLRLSSAAITSVVDRLERAGHVERVRDPVDRRRVRLRATDDSLAALSTGLQPFLDRLDAALDDFDGAERAAAQRFLRAVLAALPDPRGK